MTVPFHWNKSLATTPVALLAIAATVLIGAVFGHYLDQPKSLFLIVVAMIIWLLTGWLFGGLRAILVGLTALAAALMVSQGDYAPTFIFSCAAVLVLIADITPRARDGVSV